MKRINFTNVLFLIGIGFLNFLEEKFPSNKNIALFNEKIGSEFKFSPSLKAAEAILNILK